MNENEKVNNGTEQNGATTEGQVAQQQAAPVVVQQTTEPPKEGFWSKVKKHKKGVIGGILAALAIGGSGVFAYKKGKAAGANCAPAPDQDNDYSLDPNI